MTPTYQQALDAAILAEFQRPQALGVALALRHRWLNTSDGPQRIDGADVARAVTNLVSRGRTTNAAARC